MEVINSTGEEEGHSASERASVRTLARSMMYGRLALGFRYPDKRVRAALADPQLLDEFQVCCTVLQYGECILYLSKLRSNLPPQHPEIESAYLASFENTRGDNAFCSLNEGDYRSDVARGPLLVELKALYLHFGLIVTEEEIDLPDRLGAELEFMHFLALKQVEALDSGGDPSAYVKAQHDFQIDHLKPWVSALSVRADECVSEPFYRNWVKLTATFVDHDRDHLSLNRELF